MDKRSPCCGSPLSCGAHDPARNRPGCLWAPSQPAIDHTRLDRAVIAWARGLVLSWHAMRGLPRPYPVDIRPRLRAILARAEAGKLTVRNTAAIVGGVAHHLSRPIIANPDIFRMDP